MAFVQITDLHFVPAGETLFGLSPAERLARAIELINRDHSNAEFVLITGDLAHRGEVAAYELLHEVLARLDLPVHLMVGNHDSRAAFGEVFDSPVDENGFIQFVVPTAEGPVICLDTLIDSPARSDGALCSDRLDWLGQRIAEVPAASPWILALHHPPMTLGMPYMDSIRLADGDPLYDVLAPRPPAMMLLGHVHRPIHGVWRGIPYHIQRGVNHQVAYTTAGTPELLFCDEPPEIGLVALAPEGPMVQTRAYLDEGPTFEKP
ncbi:MAG: phosphodiesterase [Pseudomonadota bacterium]